MGKLILVTGDLATGKSTFARMLSKRYGVSVFCKDVFKEVLGDTIGFHNREENLKLSVASGALMRMILSEFIQLDRDLILESNFRQAELDALYNLADVAGYRVMTLRLQADLQVLHPRFMHRLQHENRHPVHASGGFEEFDSFCEYILQQRQLFISGDFLTINADNFAYQTNPAILDRLDKFMSKS